MTKIKNAIPKELIYCFVIAMSFLFICSKNSPIYPMNDWPDVSCIFTVGKSLNHGAILYRDIFDHKGPILYFIYAIAALISETSYIGLWFFEIISVTGFLFFSLKCVNLFTEYTNYATVLLPVLALLVLTTDAFAHGGSTEELCLLPLTYSLYYFLRILNNKDIKPIEHLLVGGCVGIIFWMKYTIVGMYIGAYLTLLVLVIIKKDLKGFLNMLKNFGGFLIVTACVVLYFVVNGALMSLWEVYFYGNIFLYGNSTPLANKIILAIGNIAGSSIVNKLLFYPIYIGFLWMILRKKKESIFCITSYATAGVFIFFGNALYYYILVLAAFSFLFLFAGCEALTFICREKKQFLPSKSNIIITTLLCIVISYFLSSNTYLLQYEKEDMPQYKFAKIISSVEDAKILNYRFLDGGFYFAAEYFPENKYFYFSNLPAPEMPADQNRMIENSIVDFVIMRNSTLEEYLITDNYILVAEDTFYIEGDDFDYYLYQKIDTLP